MNSTETALNPTVSLEARIVEAYRESGRPMTFAELKKRLPKPNGTGPKRYEELLREALLASLRDGKLFKWSSRDKNETPRFGGRDEKQVAEELARQILGGSDLPPARLSSEMDKQMAKVWPSQRRMELIQELVAEKRLFRAGNKLTCTPPDAAALLNRALSQPARNSLRRAADLFHKQGLDEEALLAALRPLIAMEKPAAEMPEGEVPALSEVEQLILKGLLDIDPSASMPLADIRSHLPAEYREGTVFDRAILNLIELGQIKAGSPMTNGAMVYSIRDAHGHAIGSIMRGLPR